MNTAWVRRSIGPVALAAAMAIGGSGATAASRAGAAVEPAIVYQYQWGWVNLTTAALGVYTPAAIDRGNSAGRRNTVNHYSTGAYLITFKGIGVSGGTVHLSMLGGPAAFCGIASFGAYGSEERVGVECFDSTGFHAEAKFTVSYLFTNYANHRLGYLFADHPSTSYDASFQTFNSAGGPNHVTRTGTGAYTVTFSGLAVARGDVQVTPFFEDLLTSSGTQPAGVVTVGDCTVSAWGPNAGGIRAFVRCFNTNGLPQDMKFTAAFMHKQGLKGPGPGPVAYVQAHRQAAASYTPDAAYRYSKPAGSMHITRQGFGKYTVTLSGMGAGGTVKVTTQSPYPIRCVVKSIRTSGSPQKVKVSCYSYGGDPTNAKFMLAYQK